MGIKRFLTGKMHKVALYTKGNAEGDTALMVQSASYPNMRTSCWYNIHVAVVSPTQDNWDMASYDGLFTTPRPHLYNGSTYDRQRNNILSTVLASAARTATTVSADQTNYNHKGIFVVFDVTAVPGGDTVQLKLQAYDGASGKYIDLLTGTAESAVGTYLYGLYPGIGDKNAIFDNYEEIMLPRTWRVQIVHSAATSFTYSVGVAYVL